MKQTTNQKPRGLLYPAPKNMVCQKWHTICDHLNVCDMNVITYRRFTPALFIPESAERIIYKQQVGH